MVTLTERGLTREDSSDLENELAVDLIQTIAAEIGNKDPGMTAAQREDACVILLEAFRTGSLKLIAIEKGWMVVDQDGGRVFVWQP